MNKLYKLIDDAIKLNKTNRKMFPNSKEILSPIEYLYQLCTVRIDVGRASGKTSYVVDNYNKSTDVVFADKNNTSYKYANIEVKSKAFTPKEIPTTIYIDEPHMIFKNKENMLSAIYNLVDSSKEQTLIILGE